jgi:hypothetical protein
MPPGADGCLHARIDGDVGLRQLWHADPNVHELLHLGDLRRLRRPRHLRPGRHGIPGMRELRLTGEDVHELMLLGRVWILRGAGGLRAIESCRLFSQHGRLQRRANLRCRLSMGRLSERYVF